MTPETPIPQVSLPMQPLHKSFRRTGILTTQIKRTERCAIYELTRPNWRAPKFEVIRIRKRGPSLCHGQPIGPREVYPSNEEWGAWGWSFIDRESAEEKYRHLNATPERTRKTISQMMSRPPANPAR